MKERPIIFTGPMVRAILDGRKTQTRRVVKPYGPNRKHHLEQFYSGARWWVGLHPRGGWWAVDNPDGPPHWMTKDQAHHGPGFPCPYGQPGDRLWVRETFYSDDFRFQGPLPKTAPPDFPWDDLYYRADGECCQQIPECSCQDYDGKTPWKPSIHMPRWASRIDLEVVAVRVERVQEIRPLSDIPAEGVSKWMNFEGGEACPVGELKARFRELWDSINKKRGFGWDVNPWVWVLEFRRVKP